MLEKPDLPDERIIRCVQGEYGLNVYGLEFLPLGADVDTAVFRAIAGDDGSTFFLKLRKGEFNEITLLLPQYLKSLGIEAVIAPIESSTRKNWASLDGYRLALYPYIPGLDGYQQKLSSHQWVEFGRTMRAVHAAPLHTEISRLLPVEAYSPQWRQSVQAYQDQVEQADYQEPVARKMAFFMRAERRKIDHMVSRASQIAEALAARSLPYVLCHSDIHPGNLHLGPKGALYIVDWDAPILAPQERDLMLVGGCATWSNPRETRLFFQGYGQAPLDRHALAYYRYERIIWDIAAYCEQLLASEEGGEDRQQSYRYFTSIFLPGHEYDLALAADGG